MKLLIAGGGPAGLMAAYHARQLGVDVTLLEAGTWGRKLLASGGGRCNLTNILPLPEFAQHFGAAQFHFVRPALGAFPPADLLNFFAAHGVPCHAPDNWHFYPQSEKSRDVLTALLNAVETSGVKLLTDTPITEILTANSQISGVVAAGKTYGCDALLVATGGAGFPALGGNRQMWRLLQSLGHNIVEPVPALCSWDTPEAETMQLAGLSLPQVTLTLPSGETESGELLFTHHGFSGPAALNLAGRLFNECYPGHPAVVKINFLSPLTASEVERMVLDFAQHSGRALVGNFVAHQLPRRLADFLANFCQLANTRVAELKVAQRQALIAALTAFKVTVKHWSPWSSAMCTAGGVARHQVRAKTLQSKLFSNLYFAGETLDVNGPCGGFNLQWAFSSGYVAAQSIARQFG